MYPGQGDLEFEGLGTVSEAPTPKSLPLGHGKRCFPSALDAELQVLIKTVGSTLGRRRWFAKNDVADLRRCPAAATSGPHASRLELRRNTTVGVHASCANLFDNWRQRSCAPVGLGDERLRGFSASLAGEPALQTRHGVAHRRLKTLRGLAYVVERATDPLHRARIDAETLGDPPHTLGAPWRLQRGKDLSFQLRC
jgi:hypothetical protein